MTAVRAMLGAGLALFLAVVSGACQGGPRGEHQPVLATIAEADDPGVGGNVSSASSLNPAELVDAHVSEGTPPFQVLAREPRLTKAPCRNCHTKPLSEMQWNRSDGRATAHWQVQLVHATDRVLACATCHQPDGELERLRMLNGDEVSFDHAYEVCAQCHSRQRSNWEGGAHGKRAGGWAPPRVVFNCTECHDPHRPAFDTRWPAHAGRAEP